MVCYACTPGCMQHLGDGGGCVILWSTKVYVGPGCISHTSGKSTNEWSSVEKFISGNDASGRHTAPRRPTPAAWLRRCAPLPRASGPRVWEPWRGGACTSPARDRQSFLVALRATRPRASGLFDTCVNVRCVCMASRQLVTIASVLSVTKRACSVRYLALPGRVCSYLGKRSVGCMGECAIRFLGECGCRDLVECAAG